ncbi:MAG: toxin-antitoxin system YwqK family antitoxin [Chitinophagales bacterium]|nr:toxin-antitoxin system YwqK family antitoxin [Chitinophagales bacterium]
MSFSKFLIITFLFITIFHLVSCQEKAKEVPMTDLNFEIGESGKSIPYLNGKVFTGHAISYHPNGNKYISQQYLDGIKNGQWIIFYESGDTQKLGYIYEGIDDSIYKEWYDNGQLRYFYYYDDGKKTGQWKTWYENGVQWTSRDFENDKLNGKVLVYDTDGTLTKEYTYKNGEMIGREFYEPAQSPEERKKSLNIK